MTDTCSLCQDGPKQPDSDWCEWCHEVEIAWPNNTDYWGDTA